MRTGYSGYLVIATMALVATMIMPLEYVQAQTESLLVKFTAKAWKDTTVLKIENNADNIYDIGLIWFTLEKGVIKSFKTVNGWRGEMGADQKTVQFRTDTAPIKPGKALSFGIKTDQKAPVFKWIILDEAGDELGTGVFDLAKFEQMQKETQPTTNGDTKSDEKQDNSQPDKTDNSQSTVIESKPNIPAAIELKSNTITAGRAVKVMGEGFVANAKLKVLLDGKPIQNIKSNSKGELKGRIIIPADTFGGTHQISIVDGKGRGASASITINEKITVVPFAVRMEQQDYKPGELVKIMGEAAVGMAVQVSVKNPTGLEILAIASSVNKEAKYTVFIPLSESATPGTYDVIVVQESRTVSTTFTVQSLAGSTISLVTDKLEYKQGENVKVSGKTRPNSDVNIRITAPDGSEVFSKALRADSTGSYEVFVPISSSLPVGQYSAIATLEGEEISISFVVVRGSVTLTVATEKEQYRNGELVRISGKGRPGEAVSITIKPPLKDAILMATITKADGAYSSLWLVAAGTDRGIYKVFAEQGEMRAETAFMISSS